MTSHVLAENAASAIGTEPATTNDGCSVDGVFCWVLGRQPSMMRCRFTLFRIISSGLQRLHQTCCCRPGIISIEHNTSRSKRIQDQVDSEPASYMPSSVPDQSLRRKDGKRATSIRVRCERRVLRADVELPSNEDVTTPMVASAATQLASLVGLSGNIWMKAVAHLLMSARRKRLDNTRVQYSPYKREGNDAVSHRQVYELDGLTIPVVSKRS